MSPSQKTKRMTEAAKRARERAKKLHHEVHGDVYKFLHQPWHVTIFIGVMALVVVIFAQLIYPIGQAPPFSSVLGRDVGGQWQSEIIHDLQSKYDDAEVQFIANGSEDSILGSPFSHAGLTPQYTELVDGIVSYPVWQRLIPFSLLVKHWFTQHATLQLAVDEAKSKDFVTHQLLPACQKDPVSATIAVQDGQIELQAGEAGRKCSEQALLASLAEAQLENGHIVIDVPVEYILPQRSPDDVQPLFDDAHHIVSQGMVIVADERRFEVPKEVFVSWLVFEEKGDSHELSLGISTERTREYVAAISAEFYTAPQPHRTELVDGVPQSTQSGSDGRAIDIDSTVLAIEQAVQQAKAEAAANVVAVSPETQYLRHYSQSDAGLNALLHDLVRQKGDYGVTVIELDGRYRSANAYGTQQYTTASTYKIFVAYSLLKEMEAGRITWGQHIRDGMNTEACWREMLHYSMNPCSWTFADMVGGWGRIQHDMHAHGLVNTYLTAHDKRSTSNDEALYFAKLETGELLQGVSRDHLLNTLKYQPFKSGIPTGVGHLTANKVGFYNGFLHDIGIVYAPHGRYVIAVMTYGGSWGGIADVARQVQNYLVQ